MNLHEYQAKELLATFGVPVPAGFAATASSTLIAAKPSGIATPNFASTSLA